MFSEKVTESRRGSLTALLRPRILFQVPLPFAPDDPLRADRDRIPLKLIYSLRLVHECSCGVIALENLYKDFTAARSARFV